MTPRVSLSLSFMVLAVATFVSLVACQGQQQQQQPTFGLAVIPGGQTAAAILASSANGLSQYFAPDGPIQPGITAIGGLPMRGAELANNGITSISSRLNEGAQSLSRAANQNGQIRMPGLDSIQQNLPISIANFGSIMRDAIRQKNNIIRGQAESGIQAGNRLQSMMRNGLQASSARR